MRVIITAVLALVGLAVFAVAPARAAPPPISAFGRMPAIASAVISPDGARVALLGGPPEQRTIFLAMVDGDSSVTIRLGQAWVRDIRWAGNEHLLVNFSALDKQNTPTSTTANAYQVNRNVVINLKGEVVAGLLDETYWARYALHQPILGVIDTPKLKVMVQGLELSSDALVMGVDTRIQAKGDNLIAALWEVDITGGKGRVTERGNRFTQSWRLDAAGSPRLRWDYDGETDILTYFVRAKGKQSWSRLDVSQTGGGVMDVLDYSDPDDSLYLRARDSGGAYIVRRGLADGVTTRIGPDKPAIDVDLQWDPYSLAPVAIVSQADRPTYQWLDPQLKAVHGKLSRAFANRHVQLWGWSEDKTRIVARVDSPDSPPAWFLFDTKTNQASSLGESYPELAGVALGTSSWITYKARDGLEIPAYLTLPPGLAAGAKPPLIVMPHGGPASRDLFEFDWWAQALASRGYAVLQPQFRGSTGFGPAFERAGNREWGGKMQEDLLDGVLALAAKGTIDGSRVCLVGASYGGYAALFGATVYPTTYRCGVSVNGVSDLGLMIGSKRRAYGEDTSLVNSMLAMMGDPASSAPALRAASPALRVKQDAAPILLIHGEEDTVVPFEQSRAMQRALKAAGKPGELVVLKGDDHHLSSSVTRIQMLEAMFAFLDRHLPVGP